MGIRGNGLEHRVLALLLDATGSSDKKLAIAFTSDNLDWWDEIGDKPFVITVAEVRAWRDAAKPRVRDEPNAHDSHTARFSDALDRLADYRMAAALGPRKPWWQAYRDTHGEPPLD